MFNIKKLLLIKCAKIYSQRSKGPVENCKSNALDRKSSLLEIVRACGQIGYPVILFHGQIFPSQVVPINSQIVPQNSQFFPQKSQCVPHMKSQVKGLEFGQN